MAATYKATQELTAVQPVLDEIRKEVAAGFDQLLTSADQGLSLVALAERLQDYLQDLPPPEPTPPTTEFIIEAEEHILVPAPWHFFYGYPKEADVHHRLIATTKSAKIVQLPDPMLPGSPERVFELNIEVQRAFEQPSDEPGKVEYILQPQTEPFEVRVPAVPPDAPLTPVQAEYVQRKEELAAQVRDLRTFIQHFGLQVSDIRNRTDGVLGSSKALIQRVDNLPHPKDHRPTLETMRQAIETLRQQIPARMQALDNTQKELQDLKQKIQAICPELAL